MKQGKRRFAAFWRVLCACVFFAGSLAQPFSGLIAGAGAADVSGDRVHYGVAAADFQLGYTGWGDKIAFSDSAAGGVTFTFKNAATNVRGGMTSRSFTLDGLHLTFDNLREVQAGKGTFALIIGNKTVPDFSGNNPVLMFWIDTDTGTVTVQPSYETILQSDRLKAENLAGKEWDFKISAPDMEGNRTLTVAGVSGTLTRAQVEAAVSLTDLSKCYFSLSGYGSCTLSVDLAAVHDGAAPCLADYGEEDFAKVDAVIESIRQIGTVTADEACGRKLADIRAAYEALGELKVMVGNLSALVEAETLYRVLCLSQQTVDFDEENIVLSFGAISDTHNSPNVPTALRVLQERAKNGLDALIIAGDITDNVVYGESTAEIPVIRKVFEDNLPDDLPLFFCLGNHDSSGGSNATVFYDMLGERFYRYDLNQQAAREQANRHMKVGNYHFVAVECDYTAKGYSDATIAWLTETLSDIVEDAAYDGEAIFIVTHAPVRSTVYGSDGGTTGLNSLLKQYPQAVVLSGHSHYALADERSIMQTDFTSVHVGAVQYMGMPNQYVESVPPWLLEGSYSLSMGTLMEVDAQGNIRVTRLNFLEDEVIKQPWVIPAPQADGSHLLYYTSARAQIGGAPEFESGAQITARQVGEERVELTFGTAADDDMVFSYRIELLKDGAPVQRFESLSGFWKTPDVDDMPDTHSVTLSGVTTARPYTVKVTALDSWGNASEAISFVMESSGEEDRQKAEEVSQLIGQIGMVTAESREAIAAARAAYDALTYDQKQLVEGLDTLEAAEDALKAFYIALDERLYSPHAADHIIGTNWWPENLSYQDAPDGGIRFAWENASSNMRMGLSPAIQLDGLHLLFRNLNVTGENARLSLILADAAQKDFDSSNPPYPTVMLIINFAEGTVTAEPGGQVILRDSRLAAQALGKRAWDVKLTARDDGSYALTVAGVTGVIPAETFTRAPGLTRPEACYVTLSAWEAANTFSVDLVGFHGGESPCYEGRDVLITEAETAAELVKAIDALGTITKESRTAIEEAEAVWKTLSAEARLLVSNADDLLAAREALDKLLAEDTSGGGADTGVMGTAAGAALLAATAIGVLKAGQKRKKH